MFVDFPLETKVDTFAPWCGPKQAILVKRDQAFKLGGSLAVSEAAFILEVRLIDELYGELQFRRESCRVDCSGKYV